MEKYSTGAINQTLGANSLRTILNDCVIAFYTGAQPINADATATGTFLGNVTVAALPFTHGSPTNALAFDAPVLKVLAKAVAEDWKFKGEVAGTIGWFRIKANPADNNTSSTTLPRIDGSVGITSGDLRLSTVTATVGGIITIDSFSINGS